MRSDPTERSPFRLAAGPAAWRGSEIESQETYTYELTGCDIHTLDTALRHATSRGLDPARISGAEFPLAQLGVRLQAIGRQLESGRGVCLIRGIPVEQYSVSEAELLLCGLGTYFGRQMPQNARGEVINHVRDAGAAAPGKHMRGYENGRQLPFHSDSCDIVGLLCIRAAQSGGLSSLVSSYAVHNAIFHEWPDLLRSLYQPFHIDRHGAGPLGCPPYYSTPVFMWHDDRLFSRFNPGYVYSAQQYADTPRLTNQQMDAIEIFSRLCASDGFRLDMMLQPGDLQVINNNVIVHARSAYQDHVEPAKKRHLLRLWLFTSELDELPVPMRDRYRDMAAWQVPPQPPTCD